MALAHGLADLRRARGVERRRGASSSSFWWRRWSEQSRSPRWMTLPRSSPSTWISMWRGRLEVFFQVDGVVAEGGLGLGARGRERRRQLVGLWATRMPRPPPPAAALMSTGKPICARRSRRLRRPTVTPPSEPGTIGTPAASRSRLASILSPIRRMCSGVGPMKLMPRSSTISAKSRVLGEEAVARDGWHRRR